MTRTVLGVVLLLAGCTSFSAPEAQSSPSADAQSSLSATVTPSSTDLQLQGDLPVQDLTYTPREFRGGFLHFPGGAFAKDSLADIVVDDTKPWLRRTTVQPYLYGSAFGDETSGDITYDRTVGRWLPAARTQVSPDGLLYAYSEWILSGTDATGPSPIGGHIHVVDVRSASDRVAYSFSGAAYYAIAGFAQEGIYFSPGCVGGAGGLQCGPEALKLWRLDPATGIATKVSDRQGSWTIAGSVAWISPLRGGPEQPNQLLRVNLSTRSDEIWDSEPIPPHQAGTCCWTMMVVGTDRDSVPVVVVPTVDDRLLLRIAQPGQTQRIFSGSGCCKNAVADMSGIWFAVAGASAPGVYLYMSSSGVHKVSDLALEPAGTIS